MDQSTLEGTVPICSFFFFFCIYVETKNADYIGCLWKGNWGTGIRHERDSFHCSLFEPFEFLKHRMYYIVKKSLEKIKDLFSTLFVNEKFIVMTFPE